MTLPIMLAYKCFAANSASEGPGVGVRAEVGAEVVGSREALGTEGAWEGCWKRLLLSAVVRVGGGCALWVGEVEDVVSRIDRVACAAIAG